jgi:hypothetical protein
MNGFTLFSFTVGPWRIMAFMPWMYMLWDAAMLLNSVSYFFPFEFQRKLTWPDNRTYLRNRRVAYLLINISHKDTQAGTYL